MSALWKDSFREIKNSITRFLSIFAIILLGVSFFVGLSATGPDMIKTMDQHFADYQLMDFQISHPLGIEDEDMEAIQALEGANVQENQVIDLVTQEDDLTLRFFGYKENQPINQYELVSGRLPEHPGEVALDASDLVQNTYQIGDKLSVSQEDQLARSDYEVVGFVNSPMYIEVSQRGSSPVGNGNLDGFAVVLNEEIMPESARTIFLRFDQLQGERAYSDDYKEEAAAIEADLDQILDQADSGRQSRLSQDLNQEIQDGQADIEAAEENLAEGRQALDEAARSLDQAQAELDNSQQAFEVAQNQALAPLLEERARLEALPDSPQKEAGLNQVQAGINQVNQAFSQEADQIQAGQAELDQNRLDLESQEAEFQEGEAQAREEIESGRQDLAEAESALNRVEDVNYLLFDRRDNKGYAEFEANADRISSISSVFSVFFFLIAALVTFTTMTRMVEEGRTYVGTMKSLGYSSLQISHKYTFYAFLAATLGAVAGLLLGYWLFPTVIYNAYESLYNVQPVVLGHYPAYTLIALVGSYLASIGATSLTLIPSLRESPAQLLRPKAPKQGKSILLERIDWLWDRLSFNYQLTFRNLFRYKGRMLMTIIGIAGCTALLVTGFGISDSIADIATIQYEDLDQYDAMVHLDPNAGQEDIAEIASEIEAKTSVKDHLLASNLQMETRDEDGTIHQASLIVPEDEEKFGDFYKIRAAESGDSLKLPDQGAIINQKLAELLDLSPGDTLSVTDPDQANYELEVVGIAENYVGHRIFMSPDYYQSVFAESPSPNLDLLKYDLSSEEAQALGENLLENDSVVGISYTENIQSIFEDVVSSLNIITIVIVLAAAGLAFIVLYNLTNINVSERIRELSTIKVLGFHNHELTLYIGRETAILTLIGMVIGLVLGIFLHAFVMRTVEVDNLMFGRQIHPSSFLYSALLTLLFLMVVMFFMHRKLRNIDMVEALKAED